MIVALTPNEERCPRHNDPFHLQRQDIRTENEIVREWADTSIPLVSICCATYNHAAFIDDAIRGFLAQETSFPFEIVIRDDASSDDTTEIVRRYANNYPNILRIIVNQSNRFIEGERPHHVWPTLAKGKYVALCEGDDFWTSPTKLQKQVDLLLKHPDAVMAVARNHFFKQLADGLHYIRTTPSHDKELLQVDDLKFYYHPSTYLIRTAIYEQIVRHYFMGHTTFGDTALRALLISRGPFALLDEVVSVYRMTGTGLWTSLGKGKQLKWEYECAKRLAKILPESHAKLQRHRLFGLLFGLLIVQIRDGRLWQATKIAPKMLWYGLLETPAFVSKRVRNFLN